MARAAHIKEMMPRRQSKGPDSDLTPRPAALQSADHRASASWDRFKLLADCLPELVMYVDANEVCKAHNNAVQDTLGVPADEINERSVRDILGDASYECVKRHVAHVLVGEETKLRQVHRDRDGRLVSFDAWYVPHRGVDDTVLGFCALLSPEPAGDPAWPLSGIARGVLVESELNDRSVNADAQGHAEDTAYDNRGDQTHERALSQFRAALQGDRFCLFQQPIVPIGAGAQAETAPRAESCEVLLRLRNEEGRLIHPGAFLNRAEEIGFMRELDRWVVDRVWRWLNDESRAHKQQPGLRLHVNLSTDSVRDESFPRFVRSIVGMDRTRAGSLCFEIAEATLLEHRMMALSCAHALRMLGCRIALDRFKGASGSFSVMLDMPVDFVKIDSSLVTDLVKDSRSATKVKIISTLAHSMGASSIAERVEDADTREALVRIGVDFVQGFGIAIPEALENLCWPPGSAARFSAQSA
jgi:PAS domain S-box-containing protein